MTSRLVTATRRPIVLLAALCGTTGPAGGVLMRHAARRAATVALIALAGLAGGCSDLSRATRTTSASPPLVSELAPSGRLRAAINFGNPILAVKNGAGEPVGLSVDLARELGRRLGVPVELVTFTAAGKVVEAVKDAQVDIAFVAIDPVRGADMLQTPPYVIIEGAYLVKNESPIRRNEEVDRPGNRIVVGNGSAYDLYLTRELKAAKLVKAPSSPLVTDVFLAQGMEVAAGVKQQLQADAKRVPGVRLLDGRFMVIQQAMGLPKGREQGARYVSAFVEEMKATGFVAAALARHNIEGAVVAPPAR
ncbi:MAG: transporter substrate-binding protein [Ramlibacter sp.]|nr:transporter substrate-binding protein [Ramlibacter sp.]